MAIWYDEVKASLYLLSRHNAWFYDGTHDLYAHWLKATIPNVSKDIKMDGLSRLCCFMI
jgi:hypothetical protein